MELQGWAILITLYCLNYLFTAGLFCLLLAERRRDRKEIVKNNAEIFELYRAELSKRDAMQLGTNQIEKLQERAKQ